MISRSLGREFLPEETQPNNSRFAVLVNRLGSNSAPTLTSLANLDGKPYTVVGVLAPGLEDRGMGQIVVPLTIEPQDRNHDRHWLTVMAGCVPVSRSRRRVGAERHLIARRSGGFRCHGHRRTRCTRRAAQERLHPTQPRPDAPGCCLAR